MKYKWNYTMPLKCCGHFSLLLSRSLFSLFLSLFVKHKFWLRLSAANGQVLSESATPTLPLLLLLCKYNFPSLSHLMLFLFPLLLPFVRTPESGQLFEFASVRLNSYISKYARYFKYVFAPATSFQLTVASNNAQWLKSKTIYHI